MAADEIRAMKAALGKQSVFSAVSNAGIIFRRHADGDGVYSCETGTKAGCKHFARFPLTYPV